MRVVVQRVSQSSVIIESDIVSSISKGLLILLGIENNDALDDVNWLVTKIINLRIFTDTDGKMNNSIIDIKGDIIVVSQFTLHAKTKKGNRPSYINAAQPKIAIPLYENFVQVLKNESKLNVLTGQFGADMKVSLINDGPVTIIIDSKNRDF